MKKTTKMNARIPRRVRDKILKEAADSVKRGVPDDPILRRIMSQTGIVLITARQWLREAKFNAGLDEWEDNQDKITESFRRVADASISDVEPAEEEKGEDSDDGDVDEDEGEVTTEEEG